MTHSFHVSRLAEIDEAAPVEPVSFPGANKIAALRRSLRRLRGLLGNPSNDAEAALKPRQRTRTR
jgi:hypothetical protein